MDILRKVMEKAFQQNETNLRQFTEDVSKVRLSKKDAMLLLKELEKKKIVERKRAGKKGTLIRLIE